MNKQLENDRKLYAKGMSQEAYIGEVIFSHGKGSYLYDIEGKKYLDWSSGTLTNPLGQCHPALVEALTKQISTLGNIHDFPSSHRLELLIALNDMTPESINNFAFASTGAEAIELALRAIYTYINEENMRIMTFKNAYHGKTCGPRLLLGWRYLSEPYKAPIQVDFPACSKCPFGCKKGNCDFECAYNIVNTFKTNPDIKVFLFEPILGAGGIHIPPMEFWKIVSEACKEYNVLMVDDEILASGGRIGKFFAFDYYNFIPDIVLISKGISSGYPFSVVAGRKEILSNKYFCNFGDVSATYASHPFGIEVALTTLRIIKDEKLLDNVNNMAVKINKELKEIDGKYSFLGDIRNIGILTAFEFVQTESSKKTGPKIAELFFKKCLDKGLKVCLGGSIIRICPPLNLTSEQIDEAFDIINSALYEINSEIK